MAEKIFVVDELRRLANQLTTTNPASDDYLAILRSIECLSNIGVDLNTLMSISGTVPDVTPNQLKAEENKPDPDYAIPDETPFEEPTILNKVEEVVDTPSDYKLEDVRKALTEAKKNGLNVAEFVRSYGVDNITAVPQSKYADMMQKLGVA